MSFTFDQLLQMSEISDEQAVAIARQPSHSWPELVRQARFASAYKRIEGENPDYAALTKEDETTGWAAAVIEARREDEAAMSARERTSGQRDLGLVEATTSDLRPLTPDERQTLMAELMDVDGGVSIGDIPEAEEDDGVSIYE